MAGGITVRLAEPATAELYDPATGPGAATGSLITARAATRPPCLPNGKVLVAGGWYAHGYLGSAELYDPATKTWTATGSLNTGRYWSHGHAPAQRPGPGGRGLW